MSVSFDFLKWRPNAFRMFAYLMPNNTDPSSDAPCHGSEPEHS